MSYKLPVLFFSCLMACFISPAIATNITIENGDSDGEGFKDPTAATPVGGNTGLTVGEQRLQVFEFAAKIWSSVIDSDVPIIIDAKFDPLACTKYSVILGSAGTTTVH